MHSTNNSFQLVQEIQEEIVNCRNINKNADYNQWDSVVQDSVLWEHLVPGANIMKKIVRKPVHISHHDIKYVDKPEQKKSIHLHSNTFKCEFKYFIDFMALRSSSVDVIERFNFLKVWRIFCHHPDVWCLASLMRVVVREYLHYVWVSQLCGNHTTIRSASYWQYSSVFQCPADSYLHSSDNIYTNTIHQ